MDRRTVLALVLVAAVILLTPKLFPPAPPAVRAPVVDSVAPAPSATGGAPSVPGVAPARTADTTAAVAPPAVAAVPVESVTVAGEQARYHFTNVGGALAQVELLRFDALGGRDGDVTLRGRRAPLLRAVGLVAGDTLRLDSVPFTVTRASGAVGAVGAAGAAGERLSFEGVADGDTVTLTYAVEPDSFLVRLDGTVRGRRAAAGAYLLLGLSHTLESFEADTIDDQRHLGFAFKPEGRDARGIKFDALDPGEREVGVGPHEWVALKNKYFIVGVLARDSASPIVELSAVGLPRESRLATQANGTIVVRPTQGRFALDVYTGPQQWQRLRALGRDFESSNPYGGWLQPVVQPFAVLVMRILLWMRSTFDISYGWVLVIFGVAVRIILWPLNQTAMRTSMKMQRIQPELNELQKRHKNDPQKLQSEMMRVYKEHDMSPFSMFSGCLPLLIPMPVLFALFFVFQNTIEFRGVPFLWLADISQKDPFYFLPILMGVSMFALSWIGSRNMPPNPQTKMMMYIFPVMMTFLLANLAAGLNLYYAVQNLASLPQQWLIAKERARTTPARK